jgi:hypothetical protein
MRSSTTGLRGYEDTVGIRPDALFVAAHLALAVARDKRIFDMWMACYTQGQIAEREDMGQKTVDDVLDI